jgi:hypothetical protein
MPIESVLFVTAVTAAFSGYALLLGWGLWYTTRR